MLRSWASIARWPRAARLGLGLAAAAGAVACAPPRAQPRPLQLLLASPEAGAAGVFLNERIQLDFSRALDPASLHARSARVVDSLGRPARGQWIVQGARLSFTPDPVLSAALDDGGYRPGETYRVELAGFPRPDGLRASDGAPLERSAAWEFQVVHPDDGARRGFLFEDASMDTGRPLVLRSERIGPRDPILVEGGEPVDPSTLFAEDFELRVWRSAATPEDPDSEEEPVARLALGARLTDNRDRRSPHATGSTWIELQPLQPLHAGDDVIYQLHLAPGARLRDFGGHPVLLAPRAGAALSHLQVEDEGSRLPLVHSEHFLGTENRSPLAVPGSDGTAWWGGESGRVEVRFLAAAGDGSDGSVTLGATLADPDLHAVRVHQPAGEAPEGLTTELTAGTGCVVLRAQGSLRLEGRLTRRSGSAPVDFLPGESLSAWIARMQSEARPVTVLVASGDVIVAGEVELDGPLILAAGGRVRLVGQEMIRASSLYVVGDRGGQASFIADLSSEVMTILSAPLELDHPSSNPLVEPLTFAVRSGPIPRQGRVRRWHPLQVAPGGRAGAGAWRVRFLGERQAGAGSGELLVDDPMLLKDCPTLRLQVELRVEPGPRWDPPWVDFVELSWEFDDTGDGE